jgi:hypothetical protein
MTAVTERNLRRLAVAGLLVVLVWVRLGPDGAIAVALALGVLELDLHLP